MAIWLRVFLISLISISILILIDTGRMLLGGGVPRDLAWFLMQTAILAVSVAGVLSVIGLLFILVQQVVSWGVHGLWTRVRKTPSTGASRRWIEYLVWIALWVILAHSYLGRVADDVRSRPGFLRLDWFVAMQDWIFPLLVAGFALFSALIGLPILLDRKGGGKWWGALALVLGIAGVFLYLDNSFLVGYYHLYHRILEILSLVLIGVLVARVLGRFVDGPVTLFGNGLRISVALILVSVVSLGIVFSGAVFRSHSHVDTILFDTKYLRRVAIEIREASDRDGDGFSRLFGGEDPDDEDSAIHPLAIDVPGDGIDQDGDGEDATLELARAIENSLRNDYGPRPGSIPHVNRVLVVTIDSLRRDRLGAVGSDGENVCPNIDRLAGQAVRFQNVYTPSASTVGTFRSTLAMSIFEADSTQSFISDLSQNGVWTSVAAPIFVTNYLRDFGPWLSRAHEIIGSESEYVELDPGRGVRGAVRLRYPSSYALTESVFVAMERSPTPSFHWAHYYDLHDWKHYEFDEIEKGLENPERYDANARLIDAEIGRLFEGLEERGLLKNTAVLLSADHGELINEHGFLGHGFYIWEPNVRVPFLLLLPGVPPKDIETPVSLISLGPTVAELLSIELNASSEPSLLGLLEAESQKPAICALDELQQFAVVRGDWKLIFGGEDRRFRLHNVRRDPEELINLVEDEGQRFIELKRLLAAKINRNPNQFRYYP